MTSHLLPIERVLDCQPSPLAHVPPRIDLEYTPVTAPLVPCERCAALEGLVRELASYMATAPDGMREASGRLVRRSRELVPDRKGCPACHLTDPALCQDCARDARTVP